MWGHKEDLIGVDSKAQEATFTKVYANISKVKQIITEAERDVSILYTKNSAIYKLISTFDLTDELGFKIRI